MANAAIRALIREGKGHQIYSQIQTGARQGMRTMSKSLAELVKTGRVRTEDAQRSVSDASEFDMLVKAA